MNRTVASLNLPKNIIEKLEKNGYFYYEDLKKDFPNIQENIEISELSSINKGTLTKTALDIYQEELFWKSIKIFYLDLDSLLIKQLIPGVITEITGLPGSGKSQICFYLALGVQDGETLFINTNKSFPPHRMKEIAQKCQLKDVEKALSKVHILEATNPVELLASVEFLEYWLSNHDIKLLIIDSISWPLKQVDFTERTALIYTVLQKLRILSNLHKFVIVVTNNLTTRISGDKIYHASSFGDSFHHIINNKILLSKDDNNLFKAKILKSVLNNNCEVNFTL